MPHENAYLISGLKDRFARALGELRAHDLRRKTLVTDLATLKAALRICAADVDPNSIAAIKPVRRDRAHYFAAALNVLRAEGAPMTTRQIAKRLLTASGHNITEDTLRPVEGALHACLSRQARTGLVTVTPHPKRWSIAP
jgi:hypothetical protein